jgi:predicted RNase H-like HicB family nuclease
MKTKIKMIVEKTDTGFSAFSEEVPVYTTGKTAPELIRNAYEAVGLYYEADNIKVQEDQVRFEMDFQQFFRYYKVLNAKFLAEKIGMNPSLLSQYIQGRKKPSEAQTKKILAGIQQIGKELSELGFIQ